jgi:membrane protein
MRWPDAVGQTLRRQTRDRVRTGADLAVQTVRAAIFDRIHGLAAEASFWTMLALPPLLLALLVLSGQLGAVIGVDTSDQVSTALLNWADGIFTEQTMRDVVEPLIVATLLEENAGLLSVGLLLALWSGSAALSNYISAITLAYDMGGLRSFWRTRLLALGLYLAALVIGAVLLPLLVLGPDLLTRLLAGLPGPDLEWLVTIGYWPVLCALSLVTLTSLYHVSVPTRTRWRRDVPGAVLALLVWVGGSVAFRAYMSSGLRGDTGPMAAPIAVLLFFFLTALAVLLGAELNATVDARWPDPATKEARRTARSSARSGGSVVDGPRQGATHLPEQDRVIGTEQ